MPARIFNVPKTDPLQLSSDDADGLTYWKELIYAGDFKKWNKQTGEVELAFSVDTERLNHWQNTIQAMKRNGVEIPVPNKHSEEVEARRGTLIDSRLQKNSKGLDSLYGKIKFKDKEAAKLAASADVSIFSDVELVDGKGNYYAQPIRHVALTDYPVIPALEKFQAIALSFDEGKPKMDMRALATKLGIAKEIPDAELEAAIEKAIDELTSAVEGGDKESPPAPKEKEIAASHSPLVLSLVAENRQSKIDSLLTAGNITPAQATKLSATFCKPEALKLSMNAEGKAVDGFDVTIETLKMATPNKTGEKTGGQILKLSNADQASDKSPAVKNAEKRAAAAAARQKR